MHPPILILHMIIRKDWTPFKVVRPFKVQSGFFPGCLEKKFTQEILNKIRSLWCTRLIFTRAHRKVGRSVWWRFHSNRLTLLALAELWKNVLNCIFLYAWGLLRKIHHMPCLHCKKKIECTCFKFAVSIDIRIWNVAWTVVQTGRSYTTPNCSNASVKWPPPALRAPPHQPQADIAVWSGRLTRQTHPHWTFSLGLC